MRSMLLVACLCAVVGCEGLPPDEDIGVVAEWRPIPTERAPGQWISEWRIVEPTQFVRLCAVSNGTLAIGLSDITDAPEHITVLAVQSDDTLACIYPEDGALADVTFQRQRTYRALITAPDLPTVYIEYLVIPSAQK